MALLFVSRPGTVVAIPMPQDTPTPLAISGWTGGEFRAIVTEFAAGRREGFQATPSLRDLIYVYSFGEQMAKLRVAGITFAGACGGGGAQTGAEYVLAYYDANRAGAQPQPLTLAIGTTAAGRFDAFLTGVDVGISQPDSRLGQFGLEFQVLPRTAGG